MSQNPVLWTPTEERAQSSRMAAFIRFLEARGHRFDDYQALWRWSVTDLDAFWAAIWDFADIRATTPYDRVLAKRVMPGAEWCPGATLNFADQVLRHAETTPDKTAIRVQSETFRDCEMTFAELRDAVASVAGELRKMGVGQGDRVVAILPNSEVAIIAMLATVSIGAIWSLCAPDMGHVAILDRFRQIEPKVLIAQDGYTHTGKPVDRRDLVSHIKDNLPELRHTVWIPVAGPLPDGALAWDSLLGHDTPLDVTPVPFDHPIWVVYSSGTTGNPKPIVHGHGGILLEGAKTALHLDIGPEDRFCWLTSSGWIMWNIQSTALAQGATLSVFDAAPNHPDMMALWRFAEGQGLTYLGAGAAFFDACRKSGIRPVDELDLSALRSIGSTGSPLSSDAYDWIYTAARPDVWLAPISGGTDLAGAFVGGNPMLPVRAGEMQCRFLGNAVRSFDEAGQELIGAVGELVCTEPLPSMPLFFWGDDTGARLHESYFDTYPGIWRHGDWIEITQDGGTIIYGRSDATINRKGLRLGSSEIYRAVEALPEVMDSLVVDLEFLGKESFMPLFVVLAEGATLDDALTDRINAAIRAEVSPRFVPNEIVAIAEVPRTLSGKKLEVPVKKLLLGGDPDTVVNRDSMANPVAFDTFIAYAADRRDN
ncbi:acetoacetate--CoA ligase [Marinibacterium profundimaris]|uniref:Acetoacetyl-CoA synthetase n=1 Tax=Marinibacterium profundimaris TaxID=1679460 RepID=A0A225NSK8_9RHOB|nr:acetoacetate--CoA ligase [Marinibacterium profundimaris]OWU77310.1 acetoacetyl-CoA synthetase [Marinibacterium profundimaris]